LTDFSFDFSDALRRLLHAISTRGCSYCESRIDANAKIVAVTEAADAESEAALFAAPQAVTFFGVWAVAPCSWSVSVAGVMPVVARGVALQLTMTHTSIVAHTSSKSFHALLLDG